MDDSLHFRGSLTKTPLRRKSILKLPVTQALIVNDDDAERLARRQSISSATSSPTSNSTPNDRRRSMGLSALSSVSFQEMNAKMAECIKLNIQNKINMRNAFSLEMIDFMAYMITKQDRTATSLQMATTSLDVSTKIYGFRVDGVHAEVLRIMCSMEEQSKKGPSKSITEHGRELEENESGQVGEVMKKKKKVRKKQRILATPDSLKTTIQTAKPSLFTMCETDVRTSDSLSQAVFPLHSTSSFFLQPYDDIILDSVSNEQILNRNDNCSIPRIEDFMDTDICPALSNFRFLDQSVDKPSEIGEDNVNQSDNIYQFDLDGSLPDNNDHVQSSMNYFDMEQRDDDVEEVQLCAPAGREVENIVDFRSILSNSRLVNTIGQYTVVPKSLNMHWAGPSHWKFRTVGKPLTNNSIGTRVAQKPSRKKKSLDLLYDPDITDNVKSKFVKSQSVNLLATTARSGWTAEKVTLPLDAHYDMKQACKYYLLPTVISCFENELNEESTDAGNTNDHCDYGDHDMSDDDLDIHADNFLTNTQPATGSEELIPNSQMPVKDNLVSPPKLVKKIVIGYSTRAKKVDMRELKNAIWNGLTKSQQIGNLEESNKQATSESIRNGIQFHKVYKDLPRKLVKTEPDALSFPISFVSLLHLANEKSLRISVVPDMSDLIVKSE